MTRLPTPGSDDGQWGNILNDFLNVEHNADGTLKKLQNLSSFYVKPSSGIPETDFSSDVQIKLNTPLSLEPGDGTITDAKVATSAAINPAKISNLITSLSGKLDTNNPQLSDARTVVRVDDATVGAGIPRHNWAFSGGGDAAVNIIDQPNNRAETDIIIRRDYSPTDGTKWVNVKDFGAIGNQATDDTGAFQAAAAYLQSQGGGILYAPAGVYLMNDQINIQGINLIGYEATFYWNTDVGSSTTMGSAFDMQPDGAPVMPPGSIQGVTLAYPSGSSHWTSGSPATRGAWMNGIKACKGALIRDVAVSNFGNGIYFQYGQERLENIRISGCYHGCYFNTTTADSGNQYIRNGENGSNGFSCYAAAPGATIRNLVITGIESNLTPFIFFQEAPSGGTFIDGLSLLLFAMEYVGNAFLYAPGQTAQNVSIMQAGAWGLMQQPPFVSDYPAGAPVMCGTMKNWVSYCNNALSTMGSKTLFEVDNMENVHFDNFGTSDPLKPAAIVSGTVQRTQFQGGDTFSKLIRTTSALQGGDLVQAGPGGTCSQYTNGIVMGVCSTPYVAAGGVALIVYRGEVNVKVSSPNTITRTSLSYLKPDPSNPGCAAQASGPQDGLTFAATYEAPSNGTVSCILLGFS